MMREFSRLLKKPLSGEDDAKKLLSALLELAKKRDKHIASVIDRTLAENEIGILLMGASHDVSKHLETLTSVRLIFPMDILPEQLFKKLTETPQSVLYQYQPSAQ